MVDNRTNFAKEIARPAAGDLRQQNQGVRHRDSPLGRAKEISAEGKSIFAHDPGGKVAEAYKNLTRGGDKLEKQREKSRAGLSR